MKIAKIIITGCFAFVVSTQSYAFFDGAIIGGRAAGMGSAYTAVAEGAEANFWNPAGMVFDKKVQAMAMRAHKYNIPLYYIDYVGVSTGKFLKRHAVGLSLYQEGVSNIFMEKTTALSYSLQIKSNFSVGITGKYFELKPGGEQETPGDPLIRKRNGYGYDASVLYHITTPPFDKLTAGLIIQNVNSQVNNENILRRFIGGLAYRINPETLFSLSVGNSDEIDSKKGKSLIWSVGAERIIKNFVALRLGFHKNEITAGVGINLKAFVLDYAYVNHSDLEGSHYVSINFPGYFKNE